MTFKSKSLSKSVSKLGLTNDSKSQEEQASKLRAREEKREEARKNKQWMSELKQRVGEFTLDVILRRSLIVDVNRPLSVPRINSEVTTDLALRQVVKLLFSKVPQFTDATDEELEELSTKCELQFAPQLFCVRRKGSVIQNAVFEGSAQVNKEGG